MIKGIILLLFLLCLHFFAQAQTYTRSLQWWDKDTSATARSVAYPQLHFRGATPSAQRLPLYTEVFSTSRSATLAQYETEPVPANELRKMQNISLKQNFELTQESMLERGAEKLRVTLLPLRKNANGQVERITNFSLSFTENILPTTPATQLRAAQPKAVTEATSSVLSSGKWVKLRVKKTGVYKLTEATLREWGFANAAEVSVWSNGCRELPRRNNELAPDDLAQQPTRLSGGSMFFYAEAQNIWTYDAQKKLFRHAQNEFDDAAYIYITNSKTTREMPMLAQAATAADETETYDYRDYHERIDTNLWRSGRRFFGEYFDRTAQRNFSFTIPSLHTENPELKLYICAAANNPSNYSVAVNGGAENTFSIPPREGDAAMNVDTALFENIPLSSENVNVTLTYKKSTADNTGVLDFITLNARAKLELKNAQLLFRDSKTVNGKTTKFNISAARGGVRVWDVTKLNEVKEIGGISASGNFGFIDSTAVLKEYLAFTEDMAMTPELVGEIGNQNLHGEQLKTYEMVIVAHPDFEVQAVRVANFHRRHDGMNVLVATTEQVYNEFSSGIADVSAIRNFVRMFYRRNSATAPKYLLLFGSGTYVNFQGKKGVGFIPTFQSDNSLTRDFSFVSDDFFVLLDDNEYLDNAGMHGALDMAIGRFPVYNAEQAGTLADKLEKYYSDLGGDWVNRCIFLADDEDGNIHMQQSEELGNFIMDSSPNFYVNKIYLDDYQRISTPMGQRYPSVTEEINSAINAGALLFNYTGHANDEWLSHKQVLTVADIQKWTNRTRFPIFVTATCEFSRFDDPWHISAGEEVLFLEKGGGIAMLSTTRLVYSNANAELNREFIQQFFKKDESGKNYRLGEIVRRTKNNTATGINQLNFSLLGDPALKINFATLTAKTDSVNNKTIDTLRALERSSISGTVEGSANDTLVVTVFDKEQRKQTLGNSGVPFAYRAQTNTIYKGKVTTKNGLFSAKFIVPQDILPEVGKGKITYAGKAGGSLVAGSTPVLVGGVSANPVVDSAPPTLRIYMNSERWVPGGTVNESPTLVALIADSSGVNTTGNGVGRDITLRLHPAGKTYTLNSYYTAAPDSYTQGRIEFPIPPLAQGLHTATLKVWDAANNSAEQSVEMVVANEEKFTINRLLNYPNPFTQKTAFFFEHNRPYVGMEALIQVFTITGKLVKTIRHTIPEGSALRSAPIEWDGRDDYGGKLGRGTYLYKAKVRCSNGEITEKLEKLVILN
ncbi:MAG: type IX secretion system sortase PorU [Prevotellaceae bacterium]|nr:type IX secretion system sortase PorU [Prevotellaceae bacterium]